ncbi:MAG: prepilin-type N-terminal cleavage/methylation domain-containing protein [Hydrogenothermaceae bacterium]|nr:prepilin-type N-terminal cleavage/methylation domain-containing protein [Hydrogenothermaceae bacterium]
MKNKKGFTIIELLVVMAISMILAGAMYSFYTTIVSENLTRSITAKKQQDIYIYLNQFIKDLSTIGFGVDIDKLKISGGNTCPLDSINNPFLTRCSDGSNDKLYFISLASRSESNSGCWGFVGNDGNIKMSDIGVSNFLSKQCTPVKDNYLFLSISKANKGIFLYDPASPDTTKANSYVFYIGNKTYPDDFIVQYYTDTNNLPSECASGTYNLERKVGNDVASPIVSCVLNFQVRYVDLNGNISTSITDINNLNAIKICMILQVGGRQRTQETPPNYSSNSGCGSFNFSNYDWRYYRWAVVEQTIPLLNIR